MFFFVFVFFILENILENIFPILTYSDEFIAIISIFGIIFLRPIFVINKNEIKIFISIVIVVFIGVLGNYIYPFQKSFVAISKDLLALIKFFAVYLFFTIRFKDGVTKRNLKLVEIFSSCYCYILFFFGVISQIFDIGMTNPGRIFNLKAFLFLYTHETFIVSAVVTMLSVLISCGVKKNRYSILAGIVVLLLSQRSKSIVFIVMFIGMYLFLYKKNDIKKYLKKYKIKIISVLICCCSVILYLTWYKIDLYISYGMTAARPALYIVSSQIMIDLFPLGSGFATFASYLSVAYDSPIYQLYNIANVSGLSPEDNYAYVSDTYWPYIIAEFGIIGTIIYFYSLVLVLKNSLFLCSRNKNSLIALISLFSYVIFACFVESYLTNATVILFSITIGYLLNPKEEIRNDKDKV